MRDPKASNAIVALVGYYSASEAEYEAEAKQRDALLRQALAQGQEQRTRAEAADGALEAALAELHAITAAAGEVYDQLEGAELNGASFRLEGERADSFRRLMRSVEERRRG